MINNEIYDLLKTRTAEIRESVEELAETDERIKSGRYTPDYVNKELYPKRNALRSQLDQAIEATGRDARKLVADYQERLRAEDELDPAAITDDIKLLTAGVPLLPRDIIAMLNRNAGNKTMTQLALRYAKEHELNLGKTYYIGNAQKIQDAETILPTVDLYCRNWIRSDKAAEMLDKFFGVVHGQS